MELTDLPNIGPVLAGNLKKIGVDTPEQLRELGAEGLFCKSAVRWTRGPASTSWRPWPGRRRACGKACSRRSTRPS